MRVQIKPIHQIQRINRLKNQLSEISSLDFRLLTSRPRKEAWCCAEVVKHIIVAQDVYTAKIDRAISKLKPVNEEVEVLTSKRIPSLLMKRFPPIDGEIRFKMKTSKQFKPMLDVSNLSEEMVNNLIKELSKSLEQLMNWVEKTRKKDVRSVRFNSAIGPIVRFNVGEACEFILCHNERHFQQLANTISALKEEV